MDGSNLPAGPADDISWINAHSNPNASDPQFAYPTLSRVGTVASPLWDQLRPHSFESQDPSTTRDGDTASTVVDGVWVTLAPGGTAPKIEQPQK